MSNGDQGTPGPPDIATIQVTVKDINCPDTPTELPFATLDPFFRDLFCQFNKTWGLGRWTSEVLAGLLVTASAAVMVLSHVVLLILNPFVLGLSQVVFTFLDSLRKELDQSFALLASSVLNELLGTDFTVQHLAAGADINAHLARAQEIGFLFHRQLLTEFLQSTGMTLDPSGGGFSEPTGPTGAVERITPMSGVRAAARFSGLAINFATANGIIATLAGLVPEVHLDEIREIGEEVAKNLGLGRLQRLALAPIIQILLAEPYKWFINEISRPTQLKLGEVVNPFSGAVMPAPLLWRSLAREGYSDDKIAALLELHRKKPGESDILTLFEGGHYDDARVQTELRRLGYDDTGASVKFEADHLKAQRPYQDEVRAAVVAAYADGHIERGELEGIVNSIPLSADERALVLIAADYKRKVPNKHLTVAQLETALEQGIIDVAEFNAALSVLGYSMDDHYILLLLTLNKLNKLKEAAAAKAARAAAKAAKGGATPPPTSTPTVP
ncbi:MAG: hypothetical protein HRJ53_07465 [Acidobacteria bacterium Pan2503]|uniref:Uncharacterized protein n=1 Tax=Candidatus Acidiferrum panamense TaxID=2741543 RepID=A0A7V8NP58_9BACT|nr:hypothetical protein [Candidatus Acidoferrum panamensis]